jgi:RimJ/RimL family protein N-acetyltransferase
MFPELARDDVFRLETRRLWLRWPHAADAEALCELAGEPEASGLANNLVATLPHPCRVEDAEYFIRVSRDEGARGEALRFVVTLKSLSRNVVGVIGVEPRDGLPQLGYWLGRSFRGRGYASEAAATLTDAFFYLARGEQLGATVPAENATSRGVLENLGFALVERSDSAATLLAENPTLQFALPRRDWREHGPAGLRLRSGSDRALT